MKIKAKSKLLLACLMGIYSGLSCSGTVGPMLASKLPYHGFYVGGSGGGNSLYGHVGQQVNLQVSAFGASVANNDFTPNTAVYQQRGFGGVLAGYDFLIRNRLLVGLEARANFLSGKVSDVNSITGTLAMEPIELRSISTAEIKQDIDLLVKPGLLICDSNSIYLIGGAITNKLKNTNQINYRQTFDTGLGFLVDLSENPVSVSQKWQWGSVFGIGAQQDLPHGLTLRLEYNHLTYKRAPGVIATTSATSVPDTGGLMNASISTSSLAKLKSDRIMLSLTYHFC